MKRSFVNLMTAGVLIATTSFIVNAKDVKTTAAPKATPAAAKKN